MRFDDHFLADIRERLPMSALAGTRVKLKRAGAEWSGLSPFNAERTPSFFVNDRKMAWFDFSSGRNGNCFTFLMDLDGLRFHEAVEECAKLAGVPMPPGYSERERQEPDAAALARREAARLEHERREAERRRSEVNRAKTVREIAHDIWTGARPITPDTPAGRYLARRGIEFAARFRSLRAARALEHRDPESDAVTRWPGLIAAVQAPDNGRFLAVWRIFLTDDGDKAPMQNPKLGLGSYTEAGGSVRLGSPGLAAHACEGIETGCGIVGLLGHREGVQAALSTSGLVNFIPPAGCERTLIWPDGDADRIKVDKVKGIEQRNESPGLKAAAALLDRLTAEQRLARVQPMPRTGKDFLDVWQASKAFMA